MKKLTALLLAFVMVLSLAACGGDTGNNASTPNNSDNANQSTEANNTGDTSEPAETGTDSESVEPITLRIAYMPNYASLWGVLSAMNTGAFEEEGITVELWEFADGPSEIAAMEGGSIDLAYIGKGAHTLCIQGRALVFAPSSGERHRVHRGPGRQADRLQQRLLLRVHSAERPVPGRPDRG